MKICKRCGRLTLIEDFGICNASPDGRNGSCRKCIAENAKRFRAEVSLKDRELGPRQEIVVVKEKPKEPELFGERCLTLAQLASRVMTGRYWAARRG